MKILAALCFGVLLTACAPLMANLTGTSQPAGDDPADQQLFVEGVEQITQQQNPEILLHLKDRFPKSPWAERADAILTLAEQNRRQKQQLKQLQQQVDDLSSNLQITLMEDRIKQYTAENQRLQKELDISNKRLEALRELTIELELK